MDDMIEQLRAEHDARIELEVAVKDYIATIERLTEELEQQRAEIDLLKRDLT